MANEKSRQFKRLNKKEEKILNKKDNRFIKSKINPVMDKVQDKIPEKLRATLETAFLKGFELVFEILKYGVWIAPKLLKYFSILSIILPSKSNLLFSFFPYNTHTFL